MNINRRRSGFGVGLLELVINLALFVAKMASGLLSGSIAILVDAFNNLGDAAGAIIAMVGFSTAAERKSSRYPYGYGRIEYVAGMVISLMIMFTALVVGQASFERLMNPTTVEFSWFFIAVPIASVLLKFGSFIYVRVINRKIQSRILAAFAGDSLFDTFMSSLTIAPLVFIDVDFPVDAVTAIALSVFLLISGLVSFVQNTEPMMGPAFKSSLRARIRQEVLRYGSFMRVRNMELHDYGAGRIVGTIEVELSPNQKRKAEADLVSAERSLRQQFGLEATIFWRG